MENQEKNKIDSSQLLELIPSDLETTLISKLEKLFGVDGSREILRMIKAIVIRRLHSIIAYSEFYLSKLDISGITINVTIDRLYRPFTYELIIRVSVSDVDPVVIKKNLGKLYKMAKIDRDLQRVTRELEAIVEAHLKEKALEDTGD